MDYYTHATWQSDTVGNNLLSYYERMALGSQGKLYVPSLLHGTLDDLALGENIVFEEVENDTLVSCTGLKNLLKIESQGKTIYITDNHNHALYFRYDALTNGLISQGATLLHIDQHADANEPFSYLEQRAESKEQSEISYDQGYIAQYVNTQTQIASFIQPALHSGLIKECIQIRSEEKLKEIVLSSLGSMNYIVDVDIDFFAHETDVSAKIELIKKLISSAKVITIATSPYFIDQTRAIELIQMLLSDIDK